MQIQNWYFYVLLILKYDYYYCLYKKVYLIIVKVFHYIFILIYRCFLFNHSSIFGKKVKFK